MSSTADLKKTYYGHSDCNRDFMKEILAIKRHTRSIRRCKPEFKEAIRKTSRLCDNKEGEDDADE